MFLLFFLVLVPVIIWFAFARPSFMRDFATLVERPEFVDGLANRLIRRSFLKGGFRGRQVVILLQYGKARKNIVVSMATGAAVIMETYDFAGYRADREGELALFALEVKHDIRLRHEDGCLKALWVPSSWFSLFSFPPPFDRTKWQSVLEAMDTLSGSLERRAFAMEAATIAGRELTESGSRTSA